MTAAERWREYLEAWAIPQHLLEAVPDSPYEWPADLWRRMEDSRAGAPPTPTRGRVLDLLPPGGSLLDVGAGTGRTSLPVAATGHPVTAVERNPGMARGLRLAAAERGVEARVIEGSWPEIAAEVGSHDVVVSANVVYDVPDLVPFLQALHHAARVGVVVEASNRHPWARLAGYYRALHRLDRPEGPTSDLLVEVVEEAVGVEPDVKRWEARGRGLRFADLKELVDFYRRRLVLPVERSGELADLLAPAIVEEEGWLMLGGGDSGMATVWWQVE